jgi:hypothetical protein
MAMQSFGQSLAHITTAGTLYNTFTTAKSMLTSATSTAASAGVIQLAPNFWQPGTLLIIDFHAGVSWATGNTMTFQINGGPTSNIAIATSGIIKVTTTGGTTEPLYAHLEVCCRSIGNGTLATVETTGFMICRGICPPGATAAANYAAAMGMSSWSEATPAVGTGFDSTVATNIDLFLAMGTSSASNGFQIQQWRVFSPNAAGY